MSDAIGDLVDRFWEKGEKYAKNNKILTLVILILVSGCFFFSQISGFFPDFYVDAYYGEKKGYGEKIKIDPRETLTSLTIPKKNERDQKKLFSNSMCQNPKSDLERELYYLVGNYPIRDMIPSIAKFDRRIAALIVGIAKKESNWGVRIPTKSGETCYNYWGYKGAGSRGMAMGYGCFATPEEGAEAIGKKIEQLVDQNLNTPGKMIVWKCGRSCAGHSPESVRKWISDVSVYYNLVAKLEG